MMAHPVSLDDIRTAETALGGVVLRTPVLENPDVNAMFGGRLLLMAENFQRTGAFNIRGAYHRILNLSPDEQSRRVVSYSSGNHRLGLARAAQILGTSTVIMMPSDVPVAKMNATRVLGAEIVAFNRDTENSADVVARIISQSGRIEVQQSAHGQVIAGAGSAVLERLETPLLLMPSWSLAAAEGSRRQQRSSWPRSHPKHRFLRRNLCCLMTRAGRFLPGNGSPPPWASVQS